MVLWIIKLTIAIITATRRAIPKPVISKAGPMMASVSSSVIALITNKNNPNVMIVAGKVKRIRIGRTKTFKIDNNILAWNAAQNPVS